MTKFKIGQHVSGVITGVQNYGAFVSLDEHTQGLIHISECKSGVVKNISREMQVGKKVDVVILDIDQYNGKISLSLRQENMPIKGWNLPQNHPNNKFFWTNYHLNLGFNPIATHRKDWETEALNRVGDK